MIWEPMIGAWGAAEARSAAETVRLCHAALEQLTEYRHDTGPLSAVQVRPIADGIFLCIGKTIHCFALHASRPDPRRLGVDSLPAWEQGVYRLGVGGWYRVPALYLPTGGSPVVLIERGQSDESRFIDVLRQLLQIAFFRPGESEAAQRRRVHLLESTILVRCAAARLIPFSLERAIYDAANESAFWSLFASYVEPSYASPD